MGWLDDLFGEAQHRRNEKLFLDLADERDKIMGTNTWGKVAQKQHEDYKRSHPVLGLFETSSGIPPEPSSIPNTASPAQKVSSGTHNSGSTNSSTKSEATGTTRDTKTTFTPIAPEKKKSSWLKKTLIWGGVATATVLGLAFCEAQKEQQKTAPSNGNVNPALPLPNDGKARQLFRVTDDARLYDSEGNHAQNMAIKKESCVIGDIVSNDPKRVGSAQQLILSQDGTRTVKAYMYGYNLQSNGTATSFADCKAVFTTMAAPLTPPKVALPPVRYAEVTGTVNLHLNTVRTKNPWGYIQSGSCVVLEGPQREGMAKIGAKMENQSERIQSGFWVIQTALREFSPADKTKCFATIGKGEIGATPSQAPAVPQTQNYPAPASPFPQAFAPYSVVSTVNADIFQDPSLSYGVKTTLNAGECVLVKGKDEASGSINVAVRKSGVMVSGWLGALNYDVNQYCDFTEPPAPSGSRLQGSPRATEEAPPTYGEPARSGTQRIQPNFAGAAWYRTNQPTTFSDRPERGGNVITLDSYTCAKTSGRPQPSYACGSGA